MAVIDYTLLPKHQIAHTHRYQFPKYPIFFFIGKKIGDNVKKNTQSHNIWERKKILNLTLCLDPFENVMGSVSAHLPSFHQVLWKSVP